MDILELVQRAAVKPEDSRFSGEEVHQCSTRVSMAMLVEIDAIAKYTSLSRSDALRSLLADSVAKVYDLCESQGPNADGLTIKECRPRSSSYISDEEYEALKRGVI